MKKYKKKKSTNLGKKNDFLNHKNRYIVVLALFFVIILIIMWRLWTMQIVEHDKYSDIAKKNHFSRKELIAQRGEIILSDKLDPYPIAVNRKYYMAYISPSNIKNEERENVSYRIAEIEALNISREKVLEKLNKINDPYEEIAHKITEKEKEEIKKKAIPGLFFKEERLRFYPGETLAASVIGFVGQGKERGYVGKYGIEAYFEDELNGAHGWQKQEVNNAGGWFSISDKEENFPENGVNLQLTIDYTVQREVEKILEEDLRKYGAEKAGVIVMNPNNGDIIAMANIPTFSLNDYRYVDDISVFKNSMVSDEYEPGSVMKTITMAIGLDTKKVAPYTTYTDTGIVKIGGYKIRNSEGKIYGLQTMTQVLEKSINTGSIYIEQLIGNKKFKEYLERFGFGRATGIELPVEANGNLHNLDNLYNDTEYYTASFGHGITVTPLQLITAYSAIANSGNMMKPRIVREKIYNEDNKKNKEMEPQIIHRVLSEETSNSMGIMLEKVISGGHAKLAGVKGYRLGGKTGTAQVVKKNSGGYEGDDFKITTFVGYGPIENPRFVVLVKYINPKNAEWAATSAAPTFSRIAKFLFGHYGIIPTESIEK